MLDPRRDQPRNSFPFSDGIGNRIHRYNSWEATSSGFWASKRVDVDVNESGIFSPPLWTRSPPRSPQNYYRSVSPESRIQAIARGQRELMEMVRNMPESSYELSLKDLVEKPSLEEGEENVIEETSLMNRNVHSREGSRSNSSRKLDQTALVKRSGNVHGGGFYLKMMFPTSWGSKKKMKKKNGSSGNDRSKVSLRSSVSEGSLKDGVDKEGWKKSPSRCVDSESGGTSITSGSSKSSGSTSSSSSSSRSNSRRERRIGGCWFLMGKPRSPTQE